MVRNRFLFDDINNKYYLFPRHLFKQLPDNPRNYESLQYNELTKYYFIPTSDISGDPRDYKNSIPGHSLLFQKNGENIKEHIMPESLMNMLDRGGYGWEKYMIEEGFMYKKITINLHDPNKGIYIERNYAKNRTVERIVDEDNVVESISPNGCKAIIRVRPRIQLNFFNDYKSTFQYRIYNLCKGNTK
jgi:hypothetical protein